MLAFVSPSSVQVSAQPTLVRPTAPAAAAPQQSRGNGAVAVATGVIAGLVTGCSRKTQQKRAGIVHLGGTLQFGELVAEKQCGPILVRLSWHDAGVFSDGNLKGGCPNAVMRFTDAGEGTFGANAGLPDVAVGLLKPITDKYVPGTIGHADLWTLAANVAIKAMGGPEIKTRFGRKDAETSSESVESQVGRLPDGDKGIDHLREIFHPKGFTDKDIVALSGAHTVGKCHLDRSGFDGRWTEDPLKFDNTYFKEHARSRCRCWGLVEMLEKEYSEEKTEKGNPQFRSERQRSCNGCHCDKFYAFDLALLKDPAFKEHVETYAKDQETETSPGGFTDKDIVALSGAHTVGDSLDMLEKEYSEEKTEKGNPQFRTFLWHELRLLV
eukprot:Skav206576  [mRNA]  locus=scaffold925:750147:763850:- [translate_table: standard]